MVRPNSLFKRDSLICTCRGFFRPGQTSTAPGATWPPANSANRAAARREDAVLRIANFGVEQGAGDLLIVQNEFKEVTAENKSNAKQAATFASVLAHLLEKGGLTRVHGGSTTNPRTRGRF